MSDKNKVSLEEVVRDLAEIGQILTEHGFAPTGKPAMRGLPARLRELLGQKKTYLDGSEEAWKQANEEIGEVLRNIRDFREEAEGQTAEVAAFDSVIAEFKRQWPGLFREG